MSQQPLTPARKQELEAQAGPIGVKLAENLGVKAHEAIAGFPAATGAARSAICRLSADSLIRAAAQETEDAPPRTEPPYTVIGVFEDGPAHSYQRFAEVFFTFEGPAGAEALAEVWARAQDGEPQIVIAAVLPGEVEAIA